MVLLKRSRSLPSLQELMEDFFFGRENDYRSGESRRFWLPPTQGIQEYFWENFPHEFGDQWQPLTLDQNQPVSSAEMPEKYQSEQSSKQSSSSSDKFYRSFKAGSGGFRSHEDYTTAVENHTTWWNKMNAERSTWLSSKRFVYCSDEDHAAELPDLTKVHKRLYSTDDSSSAADDSDNYQGTLGNSLKSRVNEVREDSESPNERSVQWYGKTPNSKSLDRPPRPSALVENRCVGPPKANQNPSFHLMKNSDGGGISTKTSSVRPKTSLEKPVLKIQSPVLAPQLPLKAPVPHPPSRRCLQSEKEKRESTHEILRRMNKKQSSKIVHDRRARSGHHSSDTSKDSSSTGKLASDCSESWNFKLSSVNAAPGTARKKWIKTQRSEKMSRRDDSSCRFTPPRNDARDKRTSVASDSSSVRRWKAVLDSVKGNGILKMEASRNSLPTRVKKLGCLVLPKNPRSFEAYELAEETRNGKQRRSRKSKLKSEVKFDSVTTKRIIELQRELSSLKLLLNSKKRSNSLISRDSLSSSENLTNSPGASRPRRACSESCTLISAYLPILFSHECYNKKLKFFEEFHQRQLLCASAKGGAPPKTKQSTPPVDGIDGNSQSKYAMCQGTNDESARNTQDQQNRRSSSPRLLSYKSVEQMPENCRMKTSPLDKFTQTEFFTPRVNFKESRSIGIQCSKEHEEIKLAEIKADKDSEKSAIWQFGPENAIGLTFRTTCNVLEMPCSSSEVPLKNKSKLKEKPKFVIGSIESKKSQTVEQFFSKKVSERVKNLEETAIDKKDENISMKSNGTRFYTFSRKNSVQLPKEYWKPQPRPSKDAFIENVESVDEVDEQITKSPSKSPSKKKSKLMTDSRTDSAVKSKEETVTRHKNSQGFSVHSCNLTKKSFNRRRLLKSIGKPTPFKVIRSE